MKHILEQYQDKELFWWVKEKIEKWGAVGSCLKIHKLVKKIYFSDWKIGIKIKGQ